MENTTNENTVLTMDNIFNIDIITTNEEYCNLLEETQLGLSKVEEEQKVIEEKKKELEEKKKNLEEKKKNLEEKKKNLEEMKKVIEEKQKERERLEKERIEKEKLELERLEKERIEKEKLELERLEKERIEKEKLELERLEKERIEKEKLKLKKLEKKRIEKEKQDILDKHMEEIKREYPDEYYTEMCSDESFLGAPEVFESIKYYFNKSYCNDKLKDKLIDTFKKKLNENCIKKLKENYIIAIEWGVGGSFGRYYLSINIYGEIACIKYNFREEFCDIEKQDLIKPTVINPTKKIISRDRLKALKYIYKTLYYDFDLCSCLSKMENSNNIFYANFWDQIEHMRKREKEKEERKKIIEQNRIVVRPKVLKMVKENFENNPNFPRFYEFVTDDIVDKLKSDNMVNEANKYFNKYFSSHYEKWFLKYAKNKMMGISDPKYIFVDDDDI